MGYANNGGIKNGSSYYGYLLPLGQAYGGPLFFTQYSFLGLIRDTLKIKYADYWGTKCKSVSDKLVLLPGKSQNTLVMYWYLGIDCFRIIQPGIMHNLRPMTLEWSHQQQPYHLFPTHLLNPLMHWKLITIFWGSSLGQLWLLRCFWRNCWLVGKLYPGNRPGTNYLYDWKLQNRFYGIYSCQPQKYKTAWQNLASHIEKMKNLRVYTLLALIIFGVSGCVGKSDKTTGKYSASEFKKISDDSLLTLVPVQNLSIFLEWSWT